MAVILAERRKQAKDPFRLLVLRSNLLLHSYFRRGNDAGASELHVSMGRMLRTQLSFLVGSLQTPSSPLHNDLVSSRYVRIDRKSC